MTRCLLLACMAVGLAALCVPAIVHVPARLVYNPSDSVARGWYRVGRPGSPHVGSIVLVRLPAGVAAFAAQRGYLPAGTPLLKRIGAVAPQSVCAREGIVRIDGAVEAVVLALDVAHRPMPVWAQCGPLAEGELYILSHTHAAFFDSRYFDPVHVSTVIGTVHPIWTWSTP